MSVPSRRLHVCVCRTRALHFDRSGPIRHPSRRQVWPQHSSTFPYVGRLPLHSVASSTATAATAATSAHATSDTSTHAWCVHDRRRHQPSNGVMMMVVTISVAVMVMVVMVVAMVMVVVMMTSAAMVTASSAATSVVVTVYGCRRGHIVVVVSTHRTACRQVTCSCKHCYFLLNTCAVQAQVYVELLYESKHYCL